MEDNDEKTGETGASIRATSVESEIDIIHLQSSHPKEQPKTRSCMSPPITKPTPTPINRSISSSVALRRDRVEQAICRGDCGITTTVHPSHTIIVPLSLAERYQNQGDLTLNEEA